MTKIEYRKKHPKCKFCKYMKIFLGTPNSFGYTECSVKMKIIRTEYPDMTNTPRIFCKCYEPRED